jgi:hypothetical protein
VTEIEVFVWHDRQGNITAVGTPHPSIAGRVKPLAAAERDVLLVKVREHEIQRLHETHYVDVIARTLAPRQGAARSP